MSITIRKDLELKVLEAQKNLNLYQIQENFQKLNFVKETKESFLVDKYQNLTPENIAFIAETSSRLVSLNFSYRLDSRLLIELLNYYTQIDFSNPEEVDLGKQFQSFFNKLQSQSRTDEILRLVTFINNKNQYNKKLFLNYLKIIKKELYVFISQKNKHFLDFNDRFFELFESTHKASSAQSSGLSLQPESKESDHFVTVYEIFSIACATCKELKKEQLENIFNALKEKINDHQVSFSKIKARLDLSSVQDHLTPMENRLWQQVMENYYPSLLYNHIQILQGLNYQASNPECVNPVMVCHRFDDARKSEELKFLLPLFPATDIDLDLMQYSEKDLRICSPLLIKALFDLQNLKCQLVPNDSGSLMKQLYNDLAQEITNQIKNRNFLEKSGELVRSVLTNMNLLVSSGMKDQRALSALTALLEDAALPSQRVAWKSYLTTTLLIVGIGGISIGVASIPYALNIGITLLILGIWGKFVERFGECSGVAKSLGEFLSDKKNEAGTCPARPLIISAFAEMTR